MAENDAPKTASDKGTAPTPDGPRRGARPRAGAVLAVILAVALVGWLVLRGGDDSGEDAADAGAEIVSVEELREAAEGSGTPIYWAGPREDAEIELSRPDSGRTYVRYLTGGAGAGDPRGEFLTVGTYVYPDAAAVLRKQGGKPGGELSSAPGGATVYFNRQRPQSVYFAFPGDDVQVEVYDPSPERALKLVRSGQVVPAG